MRQTLSMLLVCLMSLLGVAKSIPYKLTLDYSTMTVDTITHRSGEDFSYVRIDGLTNSADVNEPTVPIKSLTFEVPPLSRNFTIKILSSTLESRIKLPMALYPFELIPTKNEDSYDEWPLILGTGYTNTPAVPSIQVIEDFFLDASRHFVNVQVNPTVYDHKTRVLKLYNNLSLSLEYEECTLADMSYKPHLNGKNRVYHRIKDIAASYDGSRSNSTTNEPENVLDTYIVITPKSLTTGAEKLAAWKRQKGYKVVVKTVESILEDATYKVGSNSRCFDRESAVRSWLYDYKYNLNESKAFYCLIIGDYRNGAPVRKFKSVSGDVLEVDGSSYSPSDLYFADLETVWEFNKDSSGLYSCTYYDKPFSPSIPVGRLICTKNEEIDRYIKKLILYETFPGRGNTDYLDRGILCKHDNAVDERRDIFTYNKNISVTEYNDNKAEKWEDLRPEPSDVIESMKDAGLYSFQVHGHPIILSLATLKKRKVYWPEDRTIGALSEYSHTTSYLSSEEHNCLDELTNFDKPSILYSLGCECAPFDNYLNYNDQWEYNFGSAFTVAGDFGGPLALLNTREGYFGSSATLEMIFGSYISEGRKVGFAENETRKAPGVDRLIACRHNIIGDPELTIWTSAPDKMDATYQLRGEQLILNPSISEITGEYGVTTNTVCHASIIKSNEGSITIPLDGMNKSGFAYIYVQPKFHLPRHILITTGKTITDTDLSLTVVESKFSENNGKNSGNINNIATELNVGTDSDINIHALANIESENGISVLNRGYLSLKADNAISLKQDEVKKGGVLKLNAKSVTLDKGFSVAAGGQLMVNM